MEMKIEADDLSRPAIHALLDEHLQGMYKLSPQESVHALDLDALRKPGITFWSAWEGPLLLGAWKPAPWRHSSRPKGCTRASVSPVAARSAIT